MPEPTYIDSFTAQNDIPRFLEADPVTFKDLFEAIVN